MWTDFQNFLPYSFKRSSLWTEIKTSISPVVTTLPCEGWSSKCCLFWCRPQQTVAAVGCTVKVLEKRQIVRENKAQYVKREKEVLMRIDHPFFVKLHFTFQDDDRLCIFYHHKQHFILSLSLSEMMCPYIDPWTDICMSPCTCKTKFLMLFSYLPDHCIGW